MLKIIHIYNIKFQNSIVLFSKQRYYIISQCIRIYSYTRYIFIQYKYRHKGPCLIDNYHCLKSDHELKRCLNVNTYNASKKTSSSGCSSPQRVKCSRKCRGVANESMKNCREQPLHAIASFHRSSFFFFFFRFHSRIVGNSAHRKAAGEASLERLVNYSS